ncbi:MAG: cation-transporting P-type ATPase, partial [Pirellulaceae bacterium]|nr:cation-transporting P-type ATPase [Pirellulaceae bacterium]
QKLAQLGRMLIVITLVLCTIIVVTGWLRGLTDFWHMLEIGLSLAIAAVPEGLPAVATMTLALGMQRMARMRALVRRLPAVETLGSTTVICTDKTGTLTRNEMTVSVYVLAQRQIEVTGQGYAPTGTFQSSGQKITPHEDAHLTLALRIGVLCNDAKVERVDGEETILGDPTEAALIVAAEKANIQSEQLAAEFPRLNEIPFDSTSKRMVTVNAMSSGMTRAFVKGAPSAVLPASQSQLIGAEIAPMNDEDRQRVIALNDELAGTALRVLALAYRDVPEEYAEEELSQDLVFVGLVGMRDALREEAKSAIATCRSAGIRTVMITGDQTKTAAEIAHQLGIDVDQQGNRLRTVHGRDLLNLDAAGWQAIVTDTSVFARVSPEHKLQIVQALQQQGHVVAMTGDGVNDAPALKQADIGIAMGIKGTEVAKENADMVITDDNFASIVSAVEQGRIIYGNIIRFLHYLLSCNLSEILTVFIAMMIGWPLPLVALQILWLNLVTDVFPAFALALEPSAPDVMQRAPRDPKESLLKSSFLILIFWQGLLLTAVTLVAFGVALHWHGDQGSGLTQSTTVAFMTLSLAQVVHAFSARSQQRSIFSARLFTNGWLWAAVLVCLLLQVAAVYVPFLQRVLHTTAPTLANWILIGLCACLPLAVIEAVKLLTRSFNSQP